MGDKFKLYQGDCLEVMPTLEAGSVDMILADPPYGTVKGADLDGWSQESTKWDNVISITAMFEQANHCLRMNGAAAIFSQDPYTAALQLSAHGNLPFSYRYTWLKDHFANALLAKKAPVNYTEDISLFFKKYDTLSQHPLRAYAKRILDYIGMDLKQVNKVLGHRRAEHFFYINSTQFGLCTESTYNEIRQLSDFDYAGWYLPYREMVEIDRRFARRFALPDDQKYKSNVLSYKKPYNGHHPTEKPVPLLEDLIRTYTNEGDTVLDFTMGSGSTGCACANTGRRFLGIELDPGYFEIAQKRIAEAYGKA